LGFAFLRRWQKEFEAATVRLQEFFSQRGRLIQPFRVSALPHITGLFFQWLARQANPSGF